MTNIFVNYRTDDAGYAAALVYERLQAEFGAAKVFRDSRSLPAGADFPDELWASLRDSSVLLAVIGPDWLTLTGPSGIRRIDEADDFVRREIVEAFRCSIPVIPILLDGAGLPAADDLPVDLAALSDRQSVTLRVRADGADLDHLVKELRHYLPRPESAADHSSAPSGGINFFGRTTVDGGVFYGDQVNIGRDR